MAKLGSFNALRVATEDYLRSTRIFKTTSAGNTHDEDSMEVDAISRKGKGKAKSGKGKKGGKKGKESHSGKGYGETITETHDSMENVETVEKCGHKAAECWYKQPPKSEGFRESLNPKWQKSVKVAVNKSKKLGHQTRQHSSQFCPK